VQPSLLQKLRKQIEVIICFDWKEGNASKSTPDSYISSFENYKDINTVN